MNKVKGLFFVLIFSLCLGPVIARAEISPGQEFEQECKYAYNGTLDKESGACLLPGGELCKTDIAKDWEALAELKHCDEYKERACVNRGEKAKFSVGCCGGFRPIVDSHAFRDNCEPIQILGGGFGLVCTDCGNKKCEMGESFCNCPSDCLPGGQSVDQGKKARPGFIIRFFDWLAGLFK